MAKHDLICNVLIDGNNHEELNLIELNLVVIFMLIHVLKRNLKTWMAGTFFCIIFVVINLQLCLKDRNDHEELNLITILMLILKRNLKTWMAGTFFFFLV